MSKNLYVSATEERSGKSAVVLGVMQMLTEGTAQRRHLPPHHQ